MIMEMLYWMKYSSSLPTIQTCLFLESFSNVNKNTKNILVNYLTNRVCWILQVSMLLCWWPISGIVIFLSMDKTQFEIRRVLDEKASENRLIRSQNNNNTCKNGATTVWPLLIVAIVCPAIVWLTMMPAILRLRASDTAVTTFVPVAPTEAPDDLTRPADWLANTNSK